MKRLFALLLAVIMVLGLVACGQKEEQPEAPAVEQTPTEEKAPAAEKPEQTETPAVEETVDPEAERYGGTFVLSWTPGDTFDPMKTSGWKSYCWAMNVYEHPLERDADGNLAPGVCDFELSEDQLTMKLWVREGVTFHDGSPVEIEDVYASLQRAKALISRMKNHYVPFVESETIEGDVLTIKLHTFDLTTWYYFTARQTWNVVLPKEICEKYGEDGAITEVADAIGTGPYKLVEGNPGVEMVLERYDGYVPVPEGHNGVAAPRKAYFDKIIVTAAGDGTTDALAVLSGERHFISMDNNLADMLEQGGAVLAESTEQSMFYYAFNCDNPARPVSDVNVRKAIAAALDYNEINQLYYGRYWSESSEPTSNPNYVSEHYANADYHGAANVELAKEYLAKSNYNGEEVLVLVGSEDYGDPTPLMKERLAAVGINMTAVYMDSTAQDEFILDTNNEWDMTIATGGIADYVPNTLSSKFISATWTHEEKDQLLSDIGLVPFGSEESVAMWQRIDELLEEYCPSIILGHTPAGTFAMSADLVWDSPDNWWYWWNSYFTNPADHP